jgi:hypothetical protein
LTVNVTRPLGIHAQPQYTSVIITKVWPGVAMSERSRHTSYVIVQQASVARREAEVAVPFSIV